MCKSSRKNRYKNKYKKTDLSSILTKEDEISINESAEISKEVELNIKELCSQIIFLNEYCQSLTEYLRNKMMTIAPNLTIIVGELVADHLISHTGSLMSLVKMPVSTIQKLS